MNEINWLSVDTLCSEEMVKVWKDHFSLPPLVNDLGNFRVMPDPMGIQDFLFPPFSGKGEGTGMLYINRKHPASERVEIGYTWYPDRVRRRSKIDGLEIETITRAVSNYPGALILLTVTNLGKDPRKVEVGIKLAGRLLHTIDGWASIGPEIGLFYPHPETYHYDNDLGAMRFSSHPQAFSTQGTRPKPDAIEGKTFLYNVTLKSGESWTLHFVVALGESEEKASEKFSQLINNFDKASLQARQCWEDKIKSAFIPNNSIFSGHLPTLHTKEEGLARLYYIAFMGSLCCRRSNPLSQYGTTYITLMPNHWTTASFLWDMMISATFYALLDPDVLRKMIEVWLTVDLNKYLATDYVTGKGLGYWYAVNNTAIVRLAYNYLRWTGDFLWLDKIVMEKPIIDHLEKHALMWHTLDKNGHGLADCGGILNLLECVTTYIHEVAGFNAMWVAALRQVAGFRRLKGDLSKAKALEEDAKNLLKNVLALYADGKGYWRCKQPDSSFNDVRHIYDFIAVLESISADLPEKTKKEMVEYFQREHQTECWMRGLSTWDDDVHRSFRVDLQWTGSYPSLPAQVINGLYKIGYGEIGLKWLRKIAPIALQGPLGQAHWIETIVPPFKGGAYKCAPHFPYGADWTVASNGAHPAMFIESLFGVNATLNEGLKWNNQWGSLDTNARLENLRYQNKNYCVTRKGIREITEAL